MAGGACAWLVAGENGLDPREVLEISDAKGSTGGGAGVVVVVVVAVDWGGGCDGCENPGTGVDT